MIGNLIKGSGGRGVLEYLFAPIDSAGRMRPRAELIAGTFSGVTPRQIAKEFAAFRSLRPTVEKAVVHEMLRLSDLEVEPDDATWAAIAGYWAAHMGFDAWCAVAHGDNHIHIFASRIRVDGSVVSDSHDYRTSERIVRRIELKFGLRLQKPSHLLEADPPIVVTETSAGPGVEAEAPSQTATGASHPNQLQLVPLPDEIGPRETAASQAQLKIKEKIGNAPLPSELVASIALSAMSLKLSVIEMIDAMSAAGIDVRPNLSASGHMSGLSYRIGPVVVTAKSMGRAFTWSRMLASGLRYDPARDFPALEAARLKRP